MQLTRFTDLALRIVMRLAVDETADVVSTRSLADQLSVKYTHASKVVAALHRLGVVEARRGRAGGLRLAADADAISVGSIVRHLEGAREIVECAGENPCPLRGSCRLRGALERAQEAFYASLDTLTIADVAAAPTGPLLLSLGPGPRA